MLLDFKMLYSRCVMVLVFSAASAREMSEMSRLFKPPFPSTSLELTPKFKVIALLPYSEFLSIHHLARDSLGSYHEIGLWCFDDLL